MDATSGVRFGKQALADCLTVMSYHRGQIWEISSLSHFTENEVIIVTAISHMSQ